MSLNNTDIRLKRSKHTLSELADQSLSFGEPLFVDNTEHDSNGDIINECNAYLVLGTGTLNPTQDLNVAHSPIIKAFSKDKIGKFVFYDTEGFITDEAGNQLPVNRITATSVNMEEGGDHSIIPGSSKKYHILCQPEDDNTVYKFSLEDFGIFINGKGIMHGAAWNDYAEFRKIEGDAISGQVVCDTGKGTVKLSNSRLQPCAHVVSDTYGHIIGDEKYSIPIAVSGKALVAMDSTLSDIQIGDCVCASINGLASKMTRQEIIDYPDRILGVVCEIPDYYSIGSIIVDDRIWINIK